MALILKLLFINGVPSTILGAHTPTAHFMKTTPDVSLSLLLGVICMHWIKHHKPNNLPPFPSLSNSTVVSLSPLG